MNVAISRFSSVHDVHPAREDRSWSDFVTLLSEPIITPCTLASCARSACPHKRGACWSPAVSADGTRRGEVAALSLLVFDVDRATDAQVYALRGRLDGHRYLIHATHADRPDDRFVRVVVTLSRPVPRVAWRAFWAVAQQTIGPIADSTCADAGRIYFLPSVPRDAGYLVQVNEGEPFDVDAALAMSAIAALANGAGRVGGVAKRTEGALP